MKKINDDDILDWNFISEYPERPSGEIEVTLEYVGKPDLIDHTYGWIKNKDQ